MPAMLRHNLLSPSDIVPIHPGFSGAALRVQMDWCSSCLPPTVNPFITSYCTSSLLVTFSTSLPELPKVHVRTLSRQPQLEP